MVDFNLLAGHVALDLVNTYDNRFRPDAQTELLATYDDLVRFAAQAGLVSEVEKQVLRASEKNAQGAALRSARNLREGLARVFYGSQDEQTAPAEAIAILERHFKVAAQNRTLTWIDRHALWGWPARVEAALPVWKLADAAFQLLISEAAMRVRSCEADPCRWLFLDNSKNHTRRWCDMKICGNRMKARRFQARNAQAREPQRQQRNEVNRD